MADLKKRRLSGLVLGLLVLVGALSGCAGAGNGENTSSSPVSSDLAPQPDGDSSIGGSTEPEDNTSGDGVSSEISSELPSESGTNTGDNSANKQVVGVKGDSRFFQTRILDLEPVAADKTGTTSIRYAGGVYTFTCQGNGSRSVFTIDTSSSDVQKGILSVTARLDNHPEIRLEEGGVQYRSATQRIMAPKVFARSAEIAFTHTMDKYGVRLCYKDSYEGVTTVKEYYVTVKNHSLVIEAASDSENFTNGYTAFTPGILTGVAGARSVPIAYAEDVPVVVADDSYFVTAYVDKALSNGTSKSAANFAYADSGEAQTGIITRYDKNSAGKVNRLRERMYLTLSEEALDCAYRTSTRKSPYRDELTDLVVFEEWGGTTYGPMRLFSQREALYNRLAETYHMDKVYYIDHVWQRDGYDQSLPAHYPAGSRFGTQQEMITLINSLRGKQGWKTALHEDYWFMHPSETNQYWKEDGVKDRLVQDAEGNLKVGWSTAEMTSWAIKPIEMLYYSNLESTRIKQNYKTNGVFVDVSAAWSPSYLNQITLNADSKTSRSLSQSTAETIAFFQNLKKIHRSSVSSEGYESSVDAYSSAYAGFVEAVEREIVGDENAAIMPDYELVCIRPLMANQGMGYHTRFSEGVVSAKSFDFDRYNTMAIAYGHTGSISNMMNDVTDEHYVNTYYMFQALQSQYLDTSVNVDSIRYFDGREELTLSQAILKKYDFDHSRLHIKYSNGLELYLNFSDENWTVTLEGISYTLDKNGYAAANQSIGFVQYSCLKDGNRVDYVDCADYTYANGRGHSTNFGKLTTDKMVILRKDAADTEALTMSALSVENVTFRGVTVGLDTSKPARVTLKYGENGLDKTYTGGTDYLTTHTIELKSGLKAGTTYQYQIIAEDLSGNRAESAVGSFTTSGTPGDENPKPLQPIKGQEIRFSSQFSEINGNNSFYYFERRGEEYLPMEYDYTNLRWMGSESYLGIGSSDFHSGFSKDAAIGFQSPVSGTLQIKYQVSRMSDVNDEDGTNFALRHNSKNLYPLDKDYQNLKGSDKLTETITVDVKKGDFIYFITNKGSSLMYDQLAIDFTLTYLEIQ